MITAILIDTREPEWIQKLTFGDVPVCVTMLEVGDIWAACDDGSMLVIERKTADDFLNSLREERMLIQAQHLAEMRKEGYWTYVMISGYFERLPDGKTRTPERVTGWEWSSVQGALLTLQEMGVFVTFCAGGSDLAPAITRLGHRKRDALKLTPPARYAKVLGPAETLIASIPGIGIERSMQVLDICGTAGWAICALTDKTTRIPGITQNIKSGFRHILGLQDDSQLAILVDDSGAEVLAIVPMGTQ